MSSIQDDLIKTFIISSIVESNRSSRSWKVTVESTIFKVAKAIKRQNEKFDGDMDGQSLHFEYKAFFSETRHIFEAKVINKYYVRIIYTMESLGEQNPEMLEKVVEDLKAMKSI